MVSPMTRTQELAIVAIAIAMMAIVIATPFVTLAPNASWRARLAGGLLMLEALIAVLRRVLGA